METEMDQKETKWATEVTNNMNTLYLRVIALATFDRFWLRLPEDDRKRLGSDFAEALKTHRNALRAFQSLRGVSDSRACLEVALMTDHVSAQDYQWLMRETENLCDDIETTINKAITAKHLVLIERPRSVYWDGEGIEIDWDRHNAQWTYFWQLARHSKMGQFIDAFAFGERVERGYLTKQKYRLLHKIGPFPQSLGDNILNIAPGTQRLELDRSRIRIFEADCGGILKEITG